MYLLDTNIWLERLLDQEKSGIVGKLLDKITTDYLYITDFAFHSICVIMDRLNSLNALDKFVNDLFINGNVTITSLRPTVVKNICKTIDKYNLDFDDAYQYVAAEKYDLQIISFDSDFDNTKIGRKTPGEILSEYNNQENDGN